MLDAKTDIDSKYFIIIYIIILRPMLDSYENYMNLIEKSLIFFSIKKERFLIFN